MKPLLLIGLLAVTACKSDETKIKDLRNAQLSAQLNVDHWEYFAKSYEHPPAYEGPPKYALDSLNAARIRLDLANRDLNKFMRD